MKTGLLSSGVCLFLFLLSACSDSSSGNNSTNGSLPIISMSDRDVMELDAGQVQLEIPLTLNKTTGADISFDYSLVDGSAVAGSDYVSASASATIPAGDDRFSIFLNIIPDTQVELDESFTFVLSNINNAAADTSEARITIRNDDETSAPALQTRPANLSCDIPDAPSSTNGIQLTQVFDRLDFDAPILMLQAPGNNDRWYVVEQDGLIKTFETGDNNSTIFADLTDRAVYGGGNDERGLLGMAFHPQFQSNQQVFLYYISNINGLQTIVSRYTSANNGLTISVPAFASEDKILVLDQPASNHNGGHIAFASDGYLYIGLGDGGSGNDFYQNGLNTQSLLGSMLRIDVDSTPQSGETYVIPATNPFVGDAQVLDEIYAYGLRNPWRWSFDAQSGELYLGDVGQGAREEIDIIESGEHYGWGCFEGTLFNNNYNGDCSGISNNPPLHEYPRNEGVTVVGGYVYRGSNPQLNHLAGTYLFADFGYGTIWGLDPSATNPSATNQVMVNSGRQISSFAEDNNGELYVLSWSDGEIFRIDSAISNTFPTLLSQTGCVDPNNPQIMDSSMIPYDINAPFWSDNAVKDRWLALQDGTTINIEADGDWSFPIGSILLKNFRIDNQLVETRLLVHHQDDSWGGYSYEWNDTQTDAILVLNGKQKDINGQTYIYPSSAQCSACHTDAAGVVLGPETSQMNRNQSYAANNNAIGNQIITLDHIGLFSSSPPAVSGLPKLADPHNTLLDKTSRVKSYLHTNCSQCHRPGVVIQDVEMDLRETTEWNNRALCNIAPTRGDLGVATAQRLRPGDAQASILYLRMNRRDGNAMPPIGSTLVDIKGAELLHNWIDNLVQCP